jgi:hypothetical protein
VSLACPICEETWPEDTPSCVCSYDFTTRDPSLAIRRLEREARRGNGVWRRGLVALIALPVTFAIPSAPMAWMLAMIQLGLSAVWIVQGLVRADVANKKLEAARQLIQLPAARLISK